ncbi:phage holin family protein [Enterobacillus tribolii]|uniref:LydA family holin superfamily III n=1 Tax=Enterobacillus tribolii TaxID=1487935 RepID=A0A370R252_9GAMM|nr:phage holin family protein [Enterobacillus tribolii]MBW7984813.1 holin [Enterobacillus tribolii]RDK96004.1 LydA family holin superfamily III [Enterobacillus tribolii]
MSPKTPIDTQFIIWVIIGIFSAWGGLVRYLMDIQGARYKWRWMGAISQVIISSFTGLLGGLLIFESGASYYMAFIFSGLFGAMGSTALSYIWRYLFHSSKK